MFPGTLSGFRKRGLANGVSPFYSENEMEENGKKGKNRNWKKQPKRNKGGNGKNGRQRKKREENGKTEEIGSNTVAGDPFCKIPTLSGDPEENSGKRSGKSAG